MSENPYTKSRVVWMFDADQDRAIYESSRRWIFAQVPIALLVALAFVPVSFYIYDEFNWATPTGLAIGSIIPGLIRVFRRKVHGITEIVMQLEQQHILLHELFGNPSQVLLLGIWVYERKSRLMKLPVKMVKSAR